MAVLLWLDDERNPNDSRWHEFFPIASSDIVWVKSFAEFVDWIEQNSLPEAICFDHDLGIGPSGMDAAKWVTEYCMNKNLKLPKWNIQSANPIGKQNIASLLDSYARVENQS